MTPLSRLKLLLLLPLQSQVELIGNMGKKTMRNNNVLVHI